MGYEWDEDKSRANAAKHGLSFARAADVFDDPTHIVVASTTTAYGEVRKLAIGRIDWVLFTVVFTERGLNRRIISARRSSKDERRKYRQSTT